MKIFILHGTMFEGCEGWIDKAEVFPKAFYSYAEAEKKMIELNKNVKSQYDDLIYDIEEVEL